MSSPCDVSRLAHYRPIGRRSQQTLVACRILPAPLIVIHYQYPGKLICHRKIPNDYLKDFMQGQHVLVKQSDGMKRAVDRKGIHERVYERTKARHFSACCAPHSFCIVCAEASCAKT